MPKSSVTSSGAPRAIGPYSAGLVAGRLLFVSGQVPLDPATGTIVDGGIGAQTTRALENLKSLVEAAGLTMAHVVRTTVFLADMGEFAAMNDVYRSFFSEPFPARSTVQAARLPRDARVEIDAIASLDA